MRAGWAKKGDMGYKGARLGCQVRRSPRTEARRRRRQRGWVAIDVMLLRRVLGSLLTSRFSPRRSSLRAPVGRPEAPARRLHTLKSLAGDGGGARGAVAVAASAGLIGTLYFCTGTNDPAGEVPGKGPEQTAASAKKPLSEEATGGESMEARFERWMKRRVCPNAYADWTRDEARAMLRCGNGSMSEECFERMKSVPGFKKRMMEAAAIRAQMESHRQEANSKACSGEGD
ncbi:hypothetical protein ACP70R_044457 [Stipagrostis hirtigluma subsp. patula]